MEEILLYGNRQHLISLLESHIVDLLSNGWEVGQHEELDWCEEFLMQLDDSHPILEEFRTKNE